MSNMLSKLRTDKGLTQMQLAFALGTNQKNVTAWESGKRTPRPRMMQKIEDYFDIPKEKIFFDAFDYSK
ncbi:helix-turn-helix transcriptional regulator [Furfurilactobacillus entadae]|uniref:helix-turn-helix transcriptional regulator n=1 Tax=Furfurilactobacillus entadae TaxID=2922307 RepID=UPI0035F0B0ED